METTNSGRQGIRRPTRTKNRPPRTSGGSSSSSGKVEFFDMDNEFKSEQVPNQEKDIRERKSARSGIHSQRMGSKRIEFNFNDGHKLSPEEEKLRDSEARLRRLETERKIARLEQEAREEQEEQEYHEQSRIIIDYSDSITRRAYRKNDIVSLVALLILPLCRGTGALTWGWFWVVVCEAILVVIGIRSHVNRFFPFQIIGWIAIFFFPFLKGLGVTDLSMFWVVVIEIAILLFCFNLMAIEFPTWTHSYWKERYEKEKKNK